MPRAACAIVFALVVAVALSGCSSGHRNSLMVTTVNEGDTTVEVWLRIESIRGDMKHNGPVVVDPGAEDRFSMGDLQGLLQFTAIVGDHVHLEEEQMEPDEDWRVEVHADGTTCFVFGIDASDAARCG